jgi:AcrR family transcriptional regulator
MALAAVVHPTRKRRNQYHHGDLRHALIQEAVRTIETGGVAALTLRAVGHSLGVSRTALYRHFADKSALLAAVGREGFRAFKDELTIAAKVGAGRVGFKAMGRAYVRFAVTHPAHYRVMFGGFLEACESEPELEQEAAASFHVLVDAIVAQQQAGLLRPDAPAQMAGFVWAIVHGIAMLTIDGQLGDRDPNAEVDYALQRLSTGITAPHSRRTDPGVRVSAAGRCRPMRQQ